MGRAATKTDIEHRFDLVIFAIVPPMIAMTAVILIRTNKTDEMLAGIAIGSVITPPRLVRNPCVAKRK